jgi:hypothetical protein
MRLVRVVVRAGLAVLAIALAISLLPALYFVVDRSLASGYLRADALSAFGAAAQGVTVLLVAAAIVLLLWLRGEVRRARDAQTNAAADATMAEQRLRWEAQVRATPILRVTFRGWDTVSGKVVAVFEIENPAPHPVLEITLIVRGRDDRHGAPSTHSAQTSLAAIPNLGSSQATLDLSAFRTAKPADSEPSTERDIFTYPWLQVMVEYRAILGQRVQQEYSVWIDRPVEATEVWHFEHLRVEPAVEGFAPLEITF